MKPQLLRTAAIAGAFPLVAGSVMGANHREAPITALDHKADITDVFAFRSYDANGDISVDPSVTLIMCVDPFLEPGNGPNYFPFDDDISYEIKIDNNNDAQADVTFQVRFTTEQRLPNVFTTYAGIEGGANAPANSPDNLSGQSTVGNPVVPDRINDFNDAGLGQRQTYTITMISGSGPNPTTTEITGGGPLYAVPANVGPRTMDYEALFTAGTYTGLSSGISSFAGTVNDPFFIDLGGAFDTVNLRPETGPLPGVMSAENDAAAANVAPDFVAGYSVNAIAFQVPISLLVADNGGAEITDTLGIWGTTSRPRVTVRRAPFDARSSGTFRQIQRMGNPLVNELIIGTGMKNLFSMEQPLNDGQFADFVLDPVIARVANALYGGALGIPPVPRTDLLPLVQYIPPIAANDSNPGPVADLLRLNVAIPATAPAEASRLGFIAGDSAGFPNGRRLFDDVTDIALRVVVGGVLVADAQNQDFFTAGVNDMLGDGVNVDDVGYRTSFPYLGSAISGRAAD